MTLAWKQVAKDYKRALDHAWRSYQDLGRREMEADEELIKAFDLKLEIPYTTEKLIAALREKMENR